MLKQRSLFLMVAMFGALVLIAAACGSQSDSQSSTSETPIADDTVDPLAEPPLVAGACVEDVPDCEDTLVVTEDTLVVTPDTRDLAEPSEDPGPQTAGDDTSSGMPVNGGLTISEALATEVTGSIAVQGHIFDGGDGLQLCESLVGLGESYGCNGARISITGLDPTQWTDIIFFEGTTYTEEPITLFGELIDGALSVEPLGTG